MFGFIKWVKKKREDMENPYQEHGLPMIYPYASKIHRLERRVKYLEKRVKVLEERFRRLFDVK